jgi:hypothetical protein
MKGYFKMSFLAIWSQSDLSGLDVLANNWLTRVLFISARALSDRCLAAIPLSTSGLQWSGIIMEDVPEKEVPCDGENDETEAGD